MTLLSVIAVLCVIGEPPPATTTAADPQESVAIADAYRRLVVVVLATPLADGTTVAEAIGPEPETELELRRALHGAAQGGATRRFADGDLEVDAVVTLDTFRERVASNARLASVVSMLPGEALVATGIAAPPSKGDRRRESSRPQGWENVNAKGVELAGLAARQDCIEQIIKRIGELKLTESKRVRSVLFGPPPLANKLRDYLDEVEFGSPVYEPIQVCSITGTIEMKDVVAALKRLAKDHPAVRSMAGADFDRLPALNPPDELRAVGYGVPPIRYVMGAYRGSGLPPPDWASETLRITGRGKPPVSDEGSAQGKLKAANAASADARMKLAAKIDALPVPPDGKRTVKDILNASPELRTDVATFMRSIRRMDTRWKPDGEAEVDLEVPLARLWKIIEPYVVPDRARGSIRTPDAKSGVPKP